MWWFLALRLAETNTNELHGGGTDRPCVRTGGGGRESVVSGSGDGCVGGAFTQLCGLGLPIRTLCAVICREKRPPSRPKR